MVRRTEIGQAKRVKIGDTSGELEASEHASQAAAVIATQPIAVTLRHLLTLTETASDTKHHSAVHRARAHREWEHADAGAATWTLTGHAID